LAMLTKRAKISFGKDFFGFVLVASALLAALIIVPGLANAMNMSRFYHFLLFFLAPVCVVGLVFLSQKMTKKHQKILASFLVVLIFVPYFLFQTGTIYEVTQADSWSVSLSKNRMDPARLYGHGGYIDDYSASGAVWVSTHANLSSSKLYADQASQIYALTIIGLIYWGNVSILSNSTIIDAGNPSIVYLDTLNFIYGILYGSTTSNVRDLTFLGKMNAVNDNGGCKIFQIG